MRKLVIIGAGGHAVSVANVAICAGFEIISFVDSNKAGSKLLNREIIGNINSLLDPFEFEFSIGIGDNYSRSKVFYELIHHFPGMNFPALIHPSAIVSNFSTLDMGVTLMPLSLVGPNVRIGKFCILNSHSSIDHDSSMAEFASLAPGAVLGGAVNVGERSALSIGAIVKHGVQIGRDSVLGANSYLNEDLGERLVAYGSPAKAFKKRNPQDPYL